MYFNRAGYATLVLCSELEHKNGQLLESVPPNNEPGFFQV